MPCRSRWPSSREWRRLMSLWSCSGAICPNCPSSRPRKANPCLRSSRRSESLSSSSDPVRASGEWFPTLTGKRSFLSLSIWSGSASHSMPIKPMKPVLGLPRRPKKSRESFSWSRCPEGCPYISFGGKVEKDASGSLAHQATLDTIGQFLCQLSFLTFTHNSPLQEAKREVGEDVSECNSLPDEEVSSRTCRVSWPGVIFLKHPVRAPSRTPRLLRSQATNVRSSHRWP